MQQQSDHVAILHRCGFVFFVVGLIDIGLFAFCVIHQIPFSSSLNIVGVVCGIALMRGSLRVATFVRWLSLFMAAILMTWILILPCLLPLQLVRLGFALDPLAATVCLASFPAAALTFLWVANRLGSAPVERARAELGRRPINARIPVILGVVLPMLASALMVGLQRSDVGQRAIAQARETQGDDYRYLLSRIHCSWDAEDASYFGMVIAWNDHEVVAVPVWWNEKR